MTWWLWVPYPVQANFFSGVFSSLTFVKHLRKVVCVIEKKVVRKKGHTPGNITDLNDVTLAETFPKRQILGPSKLKEFLDDNSKFDEKGKKLSKQVESTVGKGEIAHYEQFLLFPQCFQKTCTADKWKPGVVWERVKVALNYKTTNQSKSLTVSARLWSVRFSSKSNEACPVN